ncbi:hypothetical protein BKA67DRAFT_640702 [Truncatella angustata]|uniref:Uncharacterized protein n=1 Tax=Truncatella angustata TaxID=152316 RepID=A0A9P8UW49_9PEZI|nr:uncharacterized protein BKA67DRAFT_640702 [Truncatella angustata]KAH6659442.1 hypothetical protein BKA67DRAFT_640702 [Truncatella angustata]KAH8205553.1 hypothetical protein TruAng_000259 [Truncatella angustata]
MDSRSSLESAQASKEALLTDYDRSGYDQRNGTGRTLKLHLLNVLPWILVLVLSASLALKSTQPGQAYETRDYTYWKESELKSEPSYVGRPNPSIDAAWAEILGVIQIFLTPEEAQRLDAEPYLDADTGMPMAIVTAFHDLHCLNMIRMALYPDYYPEMSKDDGLAPHIEHCLDSLRLTIMCDADTTLIPIEWSPNGNRIMPKFETVHTCRDYNTLKEWATERDSVDEEKYRENAARLREKAGLPPFI